VFLPGSCYGLRLYDSFGDGITGGGWELRTTGGKLILRDDFANGGQSPDPATATAPYNGAHSFCLPLGPVDIAPTECGILDNLMGNKVYAVKQNGAANYQFEFTNPDAGYVRRIAKPRNYVIFSELSASPLTPGVKYFVRVRTDKEGPMAEARWGAGCETGLSTAVIGCPGLIQAPAYGHSCGETRRFANGNYLYATPIVGASEYQFRIFNDEEGYDETFSRSTYILQLNWNSNVAPKLRNGYTYQVQVNAKVNGVYSGFCEAKTCTITIDNSAPANSLRQLAGGAATLWPNPVRDGQVNLSIDGLTAADQHISVDVADIYGQHVYGQEFENSGERFNTTLNLPGNIASGIYMVNITVNGETSVQRLSIIR